MKGDTPAELAWNNNTRGMDEDPCTSIDLSSPALVGLDRQQIDAILQAMPGGASNVQSIYPLSPLQEGMLFNSLLNRQSDTYVLSTAFEARSRADIDRLIEAVQTIVDRHDVLRTAVLWEQLPRALQVVCRRAPLAVEELQLDRDRDPLVQLQEWMRPGRLTLELRQAPIGRLQIAEYPGGGKWYALLHLHHLICDHQALRTVVGEVIACLEGRGAGHADCGEYRDYVIQALTELNAAQSQAFFRSKLAEVDESTAPFGLMDVYGAGERIDEARHSFDPTFSGQIREQARRSGVSPARLFHAAWALVVAQTSDRDDVVFGTVLLGAGRGRARFQRALGMSVNTLPLRLQLDGVTAAALVEQTHRELSQLRNYQRTPLTLAQRCSGISGTAPLFTALLNYRHSASDSQPEETADGHVRVLTRGEAWTNYPITVTVDELAEHFALTTQTDRHVAPQRVAGYLQTALRSLVDALAHAPETPALALQILPHDERRQLLEDFNDTQVPYPQQKLIHQLFEEQVERTPEQVAVKDSARRLTYSQLNSRANQLARRLRSLGVGTDQFVGVCTERDIDMVAAVLAVLKAGGAYVPLDPAYPAERLRYMLTDSAPKAVLTHQHLRELLPTDCTAIALDQCWDEIAREPATNLASDEVAVRSSDPAYVIYTSGSTGEPKGVVIEHRSAVNLISWALSSTPAEMFAETLLATSLNFDLSVYECFVPLACGGSVRVVQNALALAGESTEVTLINTVPSAVKALIDCSGLPSTVRVVNLAGEPLGRELVERIFAGSTAEQVSNLYGPTETTTYSTGITMPRAGGFLATIGRPIANTQIYILNRWRQPVPIGAVGEIYIGGAGLARGYLNRAELTAERFVQDPFSDDLAARIYTTGDLGRWRADGTIEYLGRKDHQVKIRGFRIELSEIEARLMRHESVQEAVVLARQDSSGDNSLVAYLVPKGTDPTISVAELRAWLRSTLPEQMIPCAFVPLERMPLTPNGKLDRRALPAPQLDAYARRDYQAPRTEVEETLAAIWQALLGVERVGRQDNFFELGGHSLLAMQLMQRLHRVGFSAEIRAVFVSPTLAELALELTRDAQQAPAVPANMIPAACEHITAEMLPLIELQSQHIDQIERTIQGGAANVQDIYPLAPLQEGILFHHLLGRRRDDVYIFQTLLSLSTQQRVQDVIEALQAVIDRHDVLRTAVLWEGLPQPVQVVQRHAVLQVEHIALDRHRDVLEQINERVDPTRQFMDLQRAPLVRLQVAEDAQCGRWYALLQLHHIVIDHVTIGHLVAEVVAHLQGGAGSLPAAIPYRDHVARALQYARTHDAAAFFRGKLADISEPTAPYGLLEVRGGAAGTVTAREELDDELANHVRSQARRLGVSVATLFHSAWAMVIARTSGRDDVVFGSVLLGRMHELDSARPAFGMFINTLPLRLRLRGLSARELIEQTQRELVELLTHEQASLALAQRCSGIDPSVPLFTAILNYRHSHSLRESDWSSAEGIRELAIQGGANYPIGLSVDDIVTGFALTAQTAVPVDPARLTAYLRTALQSLVSALESVPDSPALSLTILPESERSEVTDRFNATQVQYPRGRLIHQLIEEQAERRPDAVSLVCEDRQLTYGQLNRRANQLARLMREHGVGPDERVALHVERGLNAVIGMLAILKAGGAFVPLDVSYPRERLEYLLADCAPKVLLTQRGLSEALPAGAAHVVVLNDGEECADRADDNLDVGELGLQPRHLAYVIYTSGSTGLPKGVMVEHVNLLNLMYWSHAAFELSERSRCSAVAALGFDASVLEIWPPLTVGAKLVLAPARMAGDIDRLLTWWVAQPLDLSFLPTPIAEFAFSRNIHHPNLRTLLIGGDRLRHLPSGAPFEVVNGYGPTEATVAATMAWLVEGEATHIGQPITNTKIYILDDECKPVPVGVTGELYIGGANVARGYLNRPQLTAERFLRDPFSSDPRARMYRTGDLGRWQANGTIEYLGRNDDQVKIRGFRIEPGEIETQLVAHVHVKEAFVMAREDVLGEACLVAYAVPVDAAAADPAELRAHLKAVLPEHMVPSAIVMLERLPLTANGKVDRRVLPTPEGHAYARRQYEPPQGLIEETLADIWQQLLGVDRVGRQDNFFELGGHSLMIVQLMARLRQSGWSTEARSVFESHTLADLASAVAKQAAHPIEVSPNLIPADCTAITPQMLPLAELATSDIERIVQAVPGGAANIQDIYPLTPLQEGMLFHHLLDADSADTYVRLLLMSVDSQARLDDLIAALQTIIDRHDILRTAVLWQQLPRPVQVVHRRAELPIIRITLDPNRDALEQIEQWLGPQRLNLQQAPLLVLQVARDPHRPAWYALLRTHHLVCDNESQKVLLAELSACLEGRAGELPEVAPYRTHVAQTLASARSRHVEEFFRSKLASVDTPTAPFGVWDVRGDGGQIVEACEVIHSAIGQRVRAQARRLGTSAATMFHAVWALALAHTSGREDVVFGTVLSGRVHSAAGARNTLGMFINTLPLRVRLQDITALELVQQTQRELAELLNHEQASLALAQRCSGLTGSIPLFSTLLNYLHSTVDYGAELGAAGVSLLANRGETNYPIVLLVHDRGGEFVLEMRTDQRVHPRRMLGYVTTALRSLTEALESGAGVQVLMLNVLPDGERRQLLEFSNRAPMRFAQEKLIHQLFEEQVARTPNAVAAVDESLSMTYAELNAKANQLAHYLRNRAVDVDQLVGVCVERGLDMVIALLGILKAGGAYVPLDPSQPVDRLRQMIEDFMPRIVLTQQSLRDFVPFEPAQTIALDAQRHEIERQPTADLTTHLSHFSSGQLAYVIYTSGSTGKPKGVMVEHRNVARLFAGTQQWFQFGERDVWTLFHSFAFDFSVWELWGALLYGGRLVVVSRMTARSPQEFYRLLCEQGVTVLNQTPSAFAQLIDAQQRDPDRQHVLRLVIFGGEALELHTLRPWVKRNGADRPQLINMYGITETTVHVTYRPISAKEIESERASVIGEPIPDLQIYLRDQRGQLAPIGVAAEIHVGGDGLARGYLNRAELTRQRFIPNPYSFDSEARLYRSGDLGCWRSDGTLEYLGRNDEQVKIRGFRIELGEIEAQLARHEQVKEVAVIAREDVPGEKRLVAYVVSQDSPPFAPTTLTDTLRARVKEVLPEYMVPAAFVMLEGFPLTVNGKLDRKALPAPEQGAPASHHEPPQGETEEALAQIMQEVLRIDHIGRDDNFFDLGGHSLSAMQVIDRIRLRLSIEVSVKALFESPSIKELSAQLKEVRDARLMESIAGGGYASEDLLERIASLSASEVNELLQRLGMEARS